MTRNFAEWLLTFTDSIANYKYYIDFEKEDTFPVSSFMQKVFSTISKIRIGSDNHLPASQTDFRILLR